MTSESLVALTHAVRPRLVAKYCGQLILVVAALTLVPLATALTLGDVAVCWRVGEVAVVLGCVGTLASRLKVTESIQANEALVVTALSYVVTSAAMAWPFMLAANGPLDAWFETVSAVTTTGLSTFAHPGSMPRALLFMRAYLQWFGGLGIAVLSVALLNRNSVSLQRLIGKATGEEFIATTRIHAQRMAAVYVGLTALAIAVIVASGATVFDGVCHALAAISTGGFSTRDQSLAGLSGWPVPAAVTLFSFLGAVSLPLYFFAYRRDWRRVARDEELRALCSLACVVCIGFYLFQFGWRLPRADAVGRSVVIGTSALTTAGFTNLPIDQLCSAAKIWLMLAMTCGGGIGSTAGGVKLTRVILMLRLLKLHLHKLALPPHAVAELRIAGQPVGHEEIAQAALVIAAFVTVVVLSWLPFVAAGHDPLNALFEVTSATGTVGLSTGITGPELAPGLKALLCLDMLCGRVEFIAMLVLVSPATWFGPRGQI
jgi:trk system potassium uptake protein TrkH